MHPSGPDILEQPTSVARGCVQRVVVPLVVDDLWALWRDLSEQARVLEHSAAIWRRMGIDAREKCVEWTGYIKEAIKREGKARRLRERAREYMALYNKERHNAEICHSEQPKNV